QPLEKTFHVFKRNGEYRLKITHWFLMKSSYNGDLKGQIEEGIEKVVWVDKKDIPVLLKNSYKNIELLFNDSIYCKTALEKEKGHVSDSFSYSSNLDESSNQRSSFSANDSMIFCNSTPFAIISASATFPFEKSSSICFFLYSKSFISRSILENSFCPLKLNPDFLG